MSDKENFFTKHTKLKDVLILSSLALLLFFAVWKIFYSPEPNTVASVRKSDKEIALCALLSEIEGVGDADVMINEGTENGAVVIVCSGAKNVLVNMRIKEAVSTALGIDGNDVKIYPKKN